LLLRPTFFAAPDPRFFVGLCGNSDDDLVKAEIETKGDVVQLGFLDTFHNLTLKSVSVFDFGARTAIGPADDSRGEGTQFILKVSMSMHVACMRVNVS